MTRPAIAQSGSSQTVVRALSRRLPFVAGMMFLAAGCQRAPAPDATPRVVRVAQSGTAAVIGSDNTALQKAADMLKPGDTLEIGPGTWQMNNSLFIPSKVTVRGVPGQTILMKSAGVESRLVEDGDYGEHQVRVADPQKFRAGMGLAVKDDESNSGWDVSITSISAVEGNTLFLGPMTLKDYNVAEKHARVSNSFPILCAIQTDGVVFENLIVDGNKEQNYYLDGCRGGAIYLYISKNAVIRKCTARNYNGDGISFQITDNIQVFDCESYGHAGYGVHPGTGSDKPTVRNCRLHDNGQVGLFLCWRVRHGEFADNVMENNGRYGISIGHKDTDNLFVNNTVSGNRFCGVLFRKETFSNSGHRNTFKDNKILNNGSPKEGYGFYVEPEAGDILIANNRIAETRSGDARTQHYGVFKKPGSGSVTMQGNTMEGHISKDYFEAPR
jgi:parallel beta-helix repeat protein